MTRAGVMAATRLAVHGVRLTLRTSRAGRAVAVVLVALAALLGVAAPARADIFAVTEVPSPSGTDLDIALLNASTGARSPLPAGVNTSANEFHPSLSPDAKRIVFARVDRRAGTNRIIVVDRSTGQSADLYNFFEAAADPPGTPSFVGSRVMLGKPFWVAPLYRTDYFFGEVDLSNFPTGPFPKSTVLFFQGNNFSQPGQTFAPVVGRDGFRVLVRYYDEGSSSLLVTNGIEGINGLGETNKRFLHPTITATAPYQVLFERAIRPDFPLAFGPAVLVYKSTVIDTFQTSVVTPLPAIVNAPGLDESRPAFTADGRYLAFVRRGLDGHDRLLVFDTQTQTLLNPNGVDLGALDRSQPLGELQRIEGNVSPAPRRLFIRAQLTATGLLIGSMLQISDVDIMVQRIVGRHTLLGRRVPKLRLVGRVALGSHGRGEIRIKWDRRVHGRALRPGRYLVTPRAVTAKSVVRELGKPRVIRIRRR